MKKEFTTLLNGNWFNVIYEVYANGRKQLKDVSIVVFPFDYPIDIAELFSSNKCVHKELYEHIMAEMNNSSASEKPFGQRLNDRLNDDTSLFDLLAESVRINNRIKLGLSV